MIFNMLSCACMGLFMRLNVARIGGAVGVHDMHSQLLRMPGTADLYSYIGFYRSGVAIA